VLPAAEIGTIGCSYPIEPSGVPEFLAAVGIVDPQRVPVTHSLISDFVYKLLHHLNLHLKANLRCCSTTSPGERCVDAHLIII